MERLKEQRKRFEAELEKFSKQQALQEKELEQMVVDLQAINFSPGHQSEPTTPPEYRDYDREYGFPTIYPRRSNRYSSPSVVSPPGLSNRMSRSGSLLNSGATEALPAPQSTTVSDKLPSKSVPTSRRGSNDRVSAYFTENTGLGQRSAASYV